MARMSGEMREFEDIDGLRDEAARTKVCGALGDKQLPYFN